MRIILDECVSDLIAAALGDLTGHAVIRIGDTARGSPDTSILEIARLAEALIVTCDKDFGDLLIRDQVPSNGVLLYRTVGRLPFAEEAALIAATIERYGDELLGALTIVLPTSTRLRRLEF